MKLLFCPECRDVVRLYGFFRFCRCQRSKGRYVDDYVVEVSGSAQVLCLHNADLPASGPTKRKRVPTDTGHVVIDTYPVDAWVLPEPHERVRRGR